MSRLGMVRDFKPLQPEKTSSPIEVTLLGISIEVKPLQPEKAELPIEVTPSGILIEVKPLQPEKAWSAIVAASFIVTEAKEGLFLINLEQFESITYPYLVLSP